LSEVEPAHVDLADDQERLGVGLVHVEGLLAQGDDVVVLSLVEEDIGLADQGLDVLRIVFEEGVEHGFGFIRSPKLFITRRKGQHGLGYARLLGQGRFEERRGLGVLVAEDELAGGRHLLEDDDLVLGIGQGPVAPEAFRAATGPRRSPGRSAAPSCLCRGWPPAASAPRGPSPP